jgi:hypothetical protein
MTMLLAQTGVNQFTVNLLAIPRTAKKKIGWIDGQIYVKSALSVQRGTAFDPAQVFQLAISWVPK